MTAGKRILVAPLDWGLGHSTRCIPIIQHLRDRGAIPIIGADDGPLALLRSEFPDLEHVRVAGTHIRYGKGRSQVWSMARQFPRMIRQVRHEGTLLDRMRHELSLDAVISDQRLGLRAPGLPSVLITHQAFPFTPVAQAALRILNLHHMKRFDRCWIMDEPGRPGLAGALSHGTGLPGNARYIGTVSRMTIPEVAGGSSYRIVAVISGPEPHRSLLEQVLTERMQRIEGRHLLVRGLPREGGSRQAGNVHQVPHLPGTELAAHLVAAELIVARSGYTTLMDLAALGRSGLLVPTPGQPEQEYLGRLHQRTGRFLVQPQHDIDLEAALKDRTCARRMAPTVDRTLLDHAMVDLGSLLGG